MTTIPGFFEDVHLTESTFGKPTVTKDVLRIPVRGVSLVGEHPLAGTSDRHGWLVFGGVRESRRHVCRYIGDPKTPQGFEPERVETDGPFPPDNATICHEFTFEGMWEDPPAWIGSWIIRANTFAFEML